MIDNFKTDLVVRAAAISPEEILKAMGYSKPTSANLQRLKSVLESDEFGLNNGGFDFKFSSEGFLRALCAVVEMDVALADQRITRIKKRVSVAKAAFKPYLWVDTGFKRKSEPLFALAACEHQRYLELPKGFWRLAPHKQLGRAQIMVREHVYETGGSLGIWGEIKQYWFYYKNDAAYLLARNGEMIGKCEGSVPSKATGNKAFNLITKATRTASH